MIIHNLGFPRIGKQRELKHALEAYWKQEINQQQLLAIGSALRKAHWKLQQEAGVELLPVGDFAWYDHVLSTSLLFGVVPERHQNDDGNINLDTLFRIARGRAPTGKPAAASDMTKWFNTNYHYIVPEFAKDQRFALSDESWFQQIDEALQLGHCIKPVLLGPLSFLYLGKSTVGQQPLSLLPQLLEAYQQLLDRLQQYDVAWLQLDEPILALELDPLWIEALHTAYQQLRKGKLKLLLASYFGDISASLSTLVQLPLDGVHLDLVAEPVELNQLHKSIPADWVLSAGVINGRNVWRTDLVQAYRRLLPIYQERGDKLWLAPSCSLLHCPIDLRLETELDVEVQSWFAFGVQKCEELKLLQQSLKSGNLAAITDYSSPLQKRQRSARVHNAAVQQRLNTLPLQTAQRKSQYACRAKAQHSSLQLPLLPTTTIGSFPQTAEIRQARLAFRKGTLDKASYQQQIEQQIQLAITEQELIGLDVLVHGEAERNDMVEYFGELLDGFVFTRFGWVQSYGSRCVKPPVIVGDVARPKPMTLDYTLYAQSLTKKPVKGMLTGPVTLLGWSFPREDIAPEQIAYQLAFALADEVLDLEQHGICIIQIDEPAFREGLPLKRSQWQSYLNWAVQAFKLSCAQVQDSTQIHTHMCYSDFNDIIQSIAAMDADVITIETSRSDMALLDAFEDFAYPNEIGPGVYDIHSPNVPSISWMKQLINTAAEKVPIERLWVNPDCGLKTRDWNETRVALQHMVKACQQLRAERKDEVSA